MTSYLRVGYRCIQDWPNRICCGCTSGCEPVFIEDDSPAVTKTGRVLTDADIRNLADGSEVVDGWAYKASIRVDYRAT